MKKLYCDFLHKNDLQINFKIIFQHLNLNLIIASLVLSFRKDVGDALLDACSFDFDDEAVMLFRVAKLVRKVIFETTVTSMVPYVMNNITDYLHLLLH